MAEKTSKRKIGDMGEAAADRYLNKKGFRTLARNYRTAGGEIDVIAADSEYIVFAEVKTREVNAFERPSSAVDIRKQKKIILTAAQYLEENAVDLQPRFDVIEVVYDKRTGVIVSIEHIENAFIQTDDYAAF